MANATETENKKTEAKSAVNIIRPEKEWPWRLAGTLAVLGMIFMTAAAILTLKNDLISKRLNDLRDNFYEWGGKQGLVLEDVVISGREHTEKEDINQVLQLERGANMLKLNADDIKRRLETLPWVKEAEVRRSFFPNVLNISIRERKVKAIWQINEKFYPLDADGEVIKADYRISEPILLIVGAGAPENFKNLLVALKDGDKDYIERVKVANFISGRRWNLILDDIRNGITIKLPEENIEAAWKKLVKLDETKGIFKRKLTIIDLRLPDKVVVKLRHGSGENALKLQKAAEHKL